MTKQVADSLLLSLLQSGIGLAFGLSVPLCVRLFKFVHGGIKVTVIGVGTLLLYGFMFALLAGDNTTRRSLQLVAVTFVIFTLIGAHRHFNDPNKEPHYGRHSN